MELTTHERRLSLGAVMLHMLGIGMTLGLTFPLTSLTMEAWGSSGWVIGLPGAMAPLAILLFMPVLPHVAKRLGAIRAMMVGCAIGIAGLLIMYAIQSVPVWIVARFIIGAGLALPWLVGDIWINTAAKEESRGRVIAGYVACLFTGFSVGPLVLAAVGIEGFMPFALGCSALALAVLPLVMVGRFAPPIEAEAGSGILSAARAVPVMAVGAFLAGFTEALIFSLLTIWGLDVGLDEKGTLRLLTTCVVGGVLLQFGAGLLADSVGRQRLLWLIGLALIAVAALLHVATGLVIYLAAFMTGGLILALYGLSLTLLGERFPPAKLAVASAAFLVLYQLGSIIGPVVAGLAMDGMGPLGFILSMLIPSMIIAAVAFTERIPKEV